MVEAFALQRAQVIFLDTLDLTANHLIQKLRNANVAHVPIYYSCDVKNIDGAIDSLKSVAAKISDTFPEVHVLINDASNDTQSLTLDITPEQWDLKTSENLRHQFFLIQYLLPKLIVARKSSIINMGHIGWAVRPQGLVVPYATISDLTQTLAQEFGVKGVRVNSIMPGAVATYQQLTEVWSKATKREVLDRQALKRVLEPEEVARMALWLASDDSMGVTSQTLMVDGGWIMDGQRRS